MKKRALIILHPGFEEVEAVTPIDLLMRGKVDVVPASLNGELHVEGSHHITLKATHHFTDVVDEDFDAIILPGGPGIKEIRRHPLLCTLLKKQHAAGKLIGCICAAPLLLHDAELTTGLHYTAHPSAEKELPGITHEAVAKDGSIITSRGAGTATEFALALLQYLTDEETAREVAESICWTHGL